MDDLHLFESFCLFRSVTIGARGAIVEEPLTWTEIYPMQWREPRVDLAELAKLRWVEGLSAKELAKRLGRTEVAVQNYFQEIRRKNLIPRNSKA